MAALFGLGSSNQPLGIFNTSGIGSVVGGTNGGQVTILVSNQLPNSGTKGTGTNLSSLIYGNWSDLIIGEWGALEILANPYSPGFANGDVDIRVLQSVDIAVRHAASFAVVTDALTA